MASGTSSLSKPLQTPNTWKYEHGRHTAGANVRGGKGNNTDHQLRSLNYTKWETRCDCIDNQDVGLEAAIHLKSA